MTGTIHVLYVTDGAPAAATAADALENEDDRIAVTTAADAAAALDRLTTAPVDAVVATQELPDWTGVELLEAVREEHTELPFILVTDRMDADVADRAITAGVTDYLQRPPETDPYPLLARKIQMAVGQYRSEPVPEAEPDCDQFEFALKTTNTYVFDWNPDTGTIERYPTFEDLFGAAWEVSKPMFNAFFDFVDPAYRDRVKREIRAAIDDQTGYDVVYPIETEGERQRWVHERAAVLEGDERAIRVVGTVTDVTDMEEYERRLAQHDQPQ